MTQISQKTMNRQMNAKLIMSAFAIFFGAALIIAGIKWEVVNSWWIPDHVKKDMVVNREQRTEMIEIMREHKTTDIQVIRAIDSFKKDGLDIFGKSASVQVIVIIMGFLIFLIGFAESVYQIGSIFTARKNGRKR